MGQLACRRFANRDQLFQGMAFVCCQRYPILCHGRIPFLGPFHTLRPYESESYVTRQSKIDEALAIYFRYKKIMLSNASKCFVSAFSLLACCIIPNPFQKPTRDAGTRLGTRSQP